METQQYKYAIIFDFEATCEKGKDCKVIISSGFAKNERIASLLDNGAAGFILKPYRIPELNKLIMKVKNLRIIDRY